MLKPGLLALALSFGVTFLYADTTPSATPSPEPSPSPSSQVSPKPSSVPLNKNILLREFLKAQKSEVRAIEHRYKYELLELKAAQDAREREWQNAETVARHKFFEAHALGPDRKNYIQDFLKRKDALHKLFNEERNQHKQEQDARVTAIQKDQAIRLKDFKQALEGGKSPPSSLWPN